MTHSASVAPHTPVLLEEVLRHLITNPSGIYVDGTFGLGGHSRALAAALATDATLIGIDQDRSALEIFDAAAIPQTLHLINDNFENLPLILKNLKIETISGLLLDLGLNSFSLDDPQRGFSFSHDGPLDMRFNQRSEGPTAADLINKLSAKNLADLIFEFGEERQSRRIAREIERSRRETPITTTHQLRGVLQRCTHPNQRVKTMARVFQALRIAVNRELDVLETILKEGFNALELGGRMAVISYHSLEDRMVKRFFRTLAENVPLQPGMLPEEERIPQVRLITRKPIKATEAEIEQNSRSRSAIMRVAERIRYAA